LYGYLDVVFDYPKPAPDDLLMEVTATNRGPDPTTLHLLPTLWFRNTWAWGYDDRRPSLRSIPAAAPAIHTRHHALGDCVLYAERADSVLFTENETNAARLFGGTNPTPHVKDALHAYLVAGRHDAVD